MEVFVMFSLKPDKVSAILPWGLRIRVSQCDIKDITWTLGGSLTNEMLKIIAGAIQGAEWFVGMWKIREDGSLFRDVFRVGVTDSTEYRDVSLSVLDPQSNVTQLMLARKMQIREIPFDSRLCSIELTSSLRIRTDASGFYLHEVRLDHRMGIRLP